VEASGLFVNIFQNVIPTGIDNYSVKVYLVTNGKDNPINQPISFLGGLLWATNTQTDIRIHYRGNSPDIRYLNIKAVIE
jgi:hypothetical protein